MSGLSLTRIPVRVVTVSLGALHFRIQVTLMAPVIKHPYLKRLDKAFIRGHHEIQKYSYIETFLEPWRLLDASVSSQYLEQKCLKMKNTFFPAGKLWSQR